MADAIFISYRRDDSEGEAGRLFDDLIRAFGQDAVFMDVAGIKPGADFRKAIEDNVSSCGVFLAIVGPTWATIANPDGKRRLEDPRDFVALEIASALNREVPVIPVLVHDAKMPSADLLPEALKPFAYRNSVELTHTRWSSDVALLIEALKAYVNPSEKSDQQPLHATVPVQLPAPHPSATQLDPAVAKRFGAKAIGTAVAVVAVVALLAYFLLRPDFSGSWKSQTPPFNQDSLARLVISRTGGKWQVEAHGTCPGPGCDWGTQAATSDGKVLNAQFSPPPSGTDLSRTTEVTITIVSGGLDVLIVNRFQGPVLQRSNQAKRMFVKEE